MTNAYKTGLAILLGLLSAGPAVAGDALLGSWCDETGYRIELSPDRIVFKDREMGDPPAGMDLTLKDGVATYRQDFRPSPWPQIGLLDCTLRLLGPNAAAETCTGPGYGYMPFFALKRCPQEVIS